jgi:hypothetical protein
MGKNGYGQKTTESGSQGLIIPGFYQNREV